MRPRTIVNLLIITGVVLLGMVVVGEHFRAQSAVDFWARGGDTQCQMFGWPAEGKRWHYDVASGTCSQY
jgi:hypothetical protein